MKICRIIQAITSLKIWLTPEQLYPDVYSPSSWETFESALRKARTYVGGEVHADNELLKQVYTTLINAYEGLVKLAEPMIADADGDVTIQSWINSSANEQKRNYGGAGILRLLSMPSGGIWEVWRVGEYSGCL